MKETEAIPVFIEIVNGRTTCMCPRWRKQCNKPCEKDVVERDLYRGWEDTMRRDRYGKSQNRD